MNHDPNEQGISKLIQNIKKQFADFKNIGKRRISVRISKTFFVLNMPFMPKQRTAYNRRQCTSSMLTGHALQRQECVNLVNSQCSIK